MLLIAKFPKLINWFPKIDALFGWEQSNMILLINALFRWNLSKNGFGYDLRKEITRKVCF